jgi:hypothetical protein
MGVINNNGKKNLLPPPKLNTLYYERTVDLSGLRILKMECVSLLDFVDVKYYRLPSFIIAVNNVSLWRWRIFSDQGLPRTLQGDWRVFVSTLRLSGKKINTYGEKYSILCCFTVHYNYRNVTSTLNEFVRVTSRCVSAIWIGKINISCNLTVFIGQCTR